MDGRIQVYAAEHFITLPQPDDLPIVLWGVICSTHEQHAWICKPHCLKYDSSDKADIHCFFLDSFLMPIAGTLKTDSCQHGHPYWSELSRPYGSTSNTLYSHTLEPELKFITLFPFLDHFDDHYRELTIKSTLVEMFQPSNLVITISACQTCSILLLAQF